MTTTGLFALRPAARLLAPGAFAACLALGAGTTLAETTIPAACNPGKPAADLDGAAAEAAYECLKEALRAGYVSGTGEWKHGDMVRDYRGWVPASAFPAAPGFHGGRFLVTWVNQTGADAYTQYAEDPEIPVGTLIAKESFAVDDAGAVKAGPLFLMEKVEYDKSPDTMGWYYMAVAPGGTPMGVDPWKDCNECHVGNFAHQGGLGYPVEEARVSN